MTNQPKQKTAISQLIEELLILSQDSALSDRYRAGILTAINRAKSFESVNKQQMKEAYDQCSNDTGVFISNGDSFKDGEQYFNETYEKP